MFLSLGESPVLFTACQIESESFSFRKLKVPTNAKISRLSTGRWKATHVVCLRKETLFSVMNSVLRERPDRMLRANLEFTVLSPESRKRLSRSLKRRGKYPPLLIRCHFGIQLCGVTEHGKNCAIKQNSYSTPATQCWQPRDKPAWLVSIAGLGSFLPEPACHRSSGQQVVPLLVDSGT